MERLVRYNYNEMLTVLIVEDDEDERELLKLFVERGGYIGESASNGREALEKLRRGLRPSVILLDLALGEFDGFSFRKEQLADPQLADIPVIVISGIYDVKSAANRLGAIAYFEKPFDLRKVLGVLAQYCPLHGEPAGVGQRRG